MISIPTPEQFLVGAIVGYIFLKSRQDSGPTPPTPAPSAIQQAQPERGLRSLLPIIGRGAPISYLPPNHYANIDPVGVKAVLRLHSTGERLGVIRFKESILWQPSPEAKAIERGVAYHVTHTAMDAIFGRVSRYPSDSRKYYHPAYITPSGLDVDTFLGRDKDSILEVSVECHDATGLPLNTILELPRDTISVTLAMDEKRRLYDENISLRMRLADMSNDFQTLLGDEFGHIEQYGKGIRKTADSVGIPAEKEVWGRGPAYPRARAPTSPQEAEIRAKLERAEKLEGGKPQEAEPSAEE